MAGLRDQFERRDEEHRRQSRIIANLQRTVERQSRIIANLERTVERLEGTERSLASRATPTTTSSSSAATPGPAAQRRHRPSSAASSAMPPTTPAVSTSSTTDSTRASLEEEWVREIGHFPAGIQLFGFHPALVVRAIIASRHVAREQGLDSTTPPITWDDAYRLTQAIYGMRQDGTLPRGGGGDLSMELLRRRISHHHLAPHPSVIHAFVKYLL